MQDNTFLISASVTKWILINTVMTLRYLMGVSNSGKITGFKSHVLGFSLVPSPPARDGIKANFLISVTEVPFSRRSKPDNIKWWNEVKWEYGYGCLYSFNKHSQRIRLIGQYRSWSNSFMKAWPKMASLDAATMGTHRTFCWESTKHFRPIISFNLNNPVRQVLLLFLNQIWGKKLETIKGPVQAHCQDSVELGFLQTG